MDDEGERPWPMPDGVVLPSAPDWPMSLTAGVMMLRPGKLTDGRRYFDIRRRNRDWLDQWEATSPIPSESGPRTWAGLAWRLNRMGRSARALPWMITWDGQLVGQLMVAGITMGSARHAHMGYWIDREFAGRGIVPAAVALATDYCFAVLRLHRIEINICPENEKSLRVVEKLGFRREGFRAKYLHIAGSWRDHVLYAMNEDECPDGMLVSLLAGEDSPNLEI